MALVTHFLLYPVASDLRVWLAERWCLFDNRMWPAMPTFFPDATDTNSTVDVPWLLFALRSCKVLTHLVQQFVLHFCSLLVRSIECELWLAYSARIGLDVIAKLAKLIAFKKPRHRNFVRLYTGVQIEVGSGGHLLSVPSPVVQESGRNYERVLAF